MKNKEITKQFNKILKENLHQYIDTSILTKSHPDYPLITKIKMYPDDIKLGEDDKDALNDGESVKLHLDIDGQYSKTKANGNGTKNGFFLLKIIEMSIKIDDDQLIINDCNCCPSVNRLP